MCVSEGYHRDSFRAPRECYVKTCYDVLLNSEKQILGVELSGWVKCDALAWKIYCQYEFHEHSDPSTPS